MKVKEHLTNTADKFGYEINKDRLPLLTEKFRKQVEKYGDMYCPCQNTHKTAILCVRASICVSTVLAVVVCTRRLKIEF